MLSHLHKGTYHSLDPLLNIFVPWTSRIIVGLLMYQLCLILHKLVTFNGYHIAALGLHPETRTRATRSNSKRNMNHVFYSDLLISTQGDTTAYLLLWRPNGETSHPTCPGPWCPLHAVMITRADQIPGPPDAASDPQLSSVDGCVRNNWIANPRLRSHLHRPLIGPATCVVWTWPYKVKLPRQTTVHISIWKIW